MKLNGTTLSHQFIDMEYPTERDAVRMLMDWFHFHPGHVGIFYNPLITEHYWMVFRDLTEDENEDDYGTHHVPSIESRWEIASGWFEWTERHEPPTLKGWREILLSTNCMRTVGYSIAQLER